MDKIDLRALYLSETYCRKTGILPPSCETPQQLTIYDYPIMIKLGLNSMCRTLMKKIVILCFARWSFISSVDIELTLKSDSIISCVCTFYLPLFILSFALSFLLISVFLSLASSFFISLCLSFFFSTQQFFVAYFSFYFLFLFLISLPLSHLK